VERRTLILMTVALLVAGSCVLGIAAPAAAIDAAPMAFIGKAGDCGPGYPAGARIVTAGWIQGLGLPDDGSFNFDPLDPDGPNLPNKTDVRDGLLMQKNGPTSVCSSAGAKIKNMTPNIVVVAGTTFEFDYRKGSRCSAGSPRFNITHSAGFSFAGCAEGKATDAPQDPDNWTHVAIDITTHASPPVPMGATITAIAIVFDEGTDHGSGFAIIDNIKLDDKPTIVKGSGLVSD